MKSWGASVKDAFSGWLERALIDSRLGRPALAKLLEVDPSTVARWLSGETKPNVTTLPKLAAALGFEVPFVYRLAGYAPALGSSPEVSAEELELLGYFRRLSSDQKRIVMAAARGSPFT